MDDTARGVKLDQSTPGIVGRQHAAAGQRLDARGPTHSYVHLVAADRAHDRAVGGDLDDLARRRHADQRIAVGQAMGLVGEAAVSASCLESPDDLSRAIDFDSCAAGSMIDGSEPPHRSTEPNSGWTNPTRCCCGSVGSIRSKGSTCWWLRCRESTEGRGLSFFSPVTDRFARR